MIEELIGFHRRFCVIGFPGRREATDANAQQVIAWIMAYLSHQNFMFLNFVEFKT